MAGSCLVAEVLMVIIVGVVTPSYYLICVQAVDWRDQVHPVEDSRRGRRRWTLASIRGHRPPTTTRKRLLLRHTAAVAVAAVAIAAAAAVAAASAAASAAAPAPTCLVGLVAHKRGNF